MRREVTAWPSRPIATEVQLPAAPSAPARPSPRERSAAGVAVLSGLLPPFIVTFRSYRGYARNTPHPRTELRRVAKNSPGIDFLPAQALGDASRTSSKNPVPVAPAFLGFRLEVVEV